MLNQKHDKVTKANFNTLESTVSGHTSDISSIKTNYIPRANYAEITIAVADVNTSTLKCTKTLTGTTTASHPLVSCLTTNINTKDDELEAFGTILYADTGTNNITFTFSEVPSRAFTVQVVGF